MKPAIRVLALSGGVGGAKLALGLSRRLGAGELAVLVNTGDDFTHLGLRICPDLDTVLYTLAGVVHPEQGWGRADESFGFMDELRRQGGPDWFLLGDRDLALHVERTRRLAEGERLTSVMAEFAMRFGVASRLLPMSDAPISTVLETDAGRLEFQHYFVRLRAMPKVKHLHYAGAAQARPTDDILDLLCSRSLETIILCPSNPYLSIDPILSVPGLRMALRAARVPIIAVSPLIGGRAVKGPTTKIMQELGVEANARAIARHYPGLIDGLIIDESDHTVETREALDALRLPFGVTRILMKTLEDRERVAASALELAERLRPLETDTTSQHRRSAG
ncbi:MAG: 2-phospho-L-lactate transferase [Steroidobacteraceae bacterium]